MKIHTLLRSVLLPGVFTLILSTASSVSAQTTDTFAPLVQKLDGTLQMAVEKAPDAAQLIVIETRGGTRDTMITLLQHAGFTVKGTSADRAILIEATAREAAVLAAHENIARLSLDRLPCVR